MIWIEFVVCAVLLIGAATLLLRYGDASLFTRHDAIELAWGLIDPILEGWASQVTSPAPYEPGSWGPDEAGEFLGRDERAWLRACGGLEHHFRSG